MEDEKNFLKDLQQTEIEILKEFIKVCDKLNINYYLVGGTLIGAVRHKGFIPWDDDIDVAMLREDYERFINEGQQYLCEKYFLQTYQTDPEYPNCFAKIRNTETTFIETSVNDKNINHGVYIDIFPMDNYYKFNIFQTIKNKLIGIQLFQKYYKGKKDKKIRILILLANLIYGRKASQELCLIRDKMYKKNNKNKTEKIINYSGAWGTEKEIQLKKNYENTNIVDFENLKCKIPSGYDEILTNTYGNYMELPPIEKRVAHHYADAIDVNCSYKEYLKLERKDK